jgi:hypothetical protein|tara:strand:- start:597 stop:986 length:390 start_codon:yes stop_codon:yes gene_type:complete
MSESILNRHQATIDRRKAESEPTGVTMSENTPKKTAEPKYSYEDFITHINQHKNHDTWSGFVGGMTQSSNGKVNEDNIQNKLKMVRGALSGTGLSMPKLPKAPSAKSRSLSKRQSIKVAMKASGFGWGK